MSDDFDPGQDDGDLCLAFGVATADAGQRLDRFLVGRVETQDAGLSRTRLKSLVESGAVSVDGRLVEDAGAKVKTGQKFFCAFPRRRIFRRAARPWRSRSASRTSI